MGWNIDLITNTVRINLRIAKELHKVGRGDIEEPEYGNGYLLYFNSDDMEHMDYVCQKDVQKILKKHKVKGDICFSSNEGDNAGEIWGYRFDGKGGMVELVGTLTFKVK